MIRGVLVVAVLLQFPPAFSSAATPADSTPAGKDQVETLVQKESAVGAVALLIGSALEKQ